MTDLLDYLLNIIDTTGAPEQEESAAKATAEAKSKKAARNARRRPEQATPSAATAQTRTSQSVNQEQGALQPESWPGVRLQIPYVHDMNALKVQPQALYPNRHQSWTSGLQIQELLHNRTGNCARSLRCAHFIRRTE